MLLVPPASSSLTKPPPAPSPHPPSRPAAGASSGGAFSFGGAGAATGSGSIFSFSAAAGGGGDAAAPAAAAPAAGSLFGATPVSGTPLFGAAQAAPPKVELPAGGTVQTGEEDERTVFSGACGCAGPCEWREEGGRPVPEIVGRLPWRVRQGLTAWLAGTPPYTNPPGEGALFEFDTAKQWRERGRGEMRLNVGPRRGSVSSGATCRLLPELPTGMHTQPAFSSHVR